LGNDLAELFCEAVEASLLGPVHAARALSGAVLPALVLAVLWRRSPGGSGVVVVVQNFLAGRVKVAKTVISQRVAHCVLFQESVRVRRNCVDLPVLGYVGAEAFCSLHAVKLELEFRGLFQVFLVGDIRSQERRKNLGLVQLLQRDLDPVIAVRS